MLVYPFHIRPLDAVAYLPASAERMKTEAPVRLLHVQIRLFSHRTSDRLCPMSIAWDVWTTLKFRREHRPYASERVPVIPGEVDTARRTAGAAVAVLSTPTKGMSPTRSRTPRIGHAPSVERSRVPVKAPLPKVAIHVVQAPAVGFLLPHRMSLSAAVGDKPGVCFFILSAKG